MRAHQPTHLVFINSLNLHNNPVRQVLYFPQFTKEETEAHRNSKSFCPGYIASKQYTQDLNSGNLVPGLSPCHLTSFPKDFSLPQNCNPLNISLLLYLLHTLTISLSYSLYTLCFFICFMFAPALQLNYKFLADKATRDLLLAPTSSRVLEVHSVPTFSCFF